MENNENLVCDANYKKKLEVITPTDMGFENEDIVELVSKLQKEQKEVRNLYYAENVPIERILSRTIQQIIKIKLDDLRRERLNQKAKIRIKV